jgi:fructose-bisphosphate aldolase class II
MPYMPFVLHGGSYLDLDTYKKSINLGVAKININTELRKAYTNVLKANILNKPDEYAPYRLLSGAKEAMQEVVYTKLREFKNDN